MGVSASGIGLAGGGLGVLDMGGVAIMIFIFSDMVGDDVPVPSDSPASGLLDGAIGAAGGDSA